MLQPSSVNTMKFLLTVMTCLATEISVDLYIIIDQTMYIHRLDTHGRMIAIVLMSFQL